MVLEVQFMWSLKAIPSGFFTEVEEHNDLTRLLRAPNLLGAPLALALLPKIKSAARARALTQN